MQFRSYARSLSGVAATLALTPLWAHAMTCEQLKALSLPQVTIDSSTSVAAGPFVDENMDWLPPAQVPKHCRVRGTIRPTADSDIKFEVWMPASGWNGKLQGVGNGGYAGKINRGGGLVQAVQRGYAGVSTDTGHTGEDAETTWAKHHPEKVVDYAHRAVHLMTVNAKAIVKAYYGAAPKRSYFAACSNGGRQALMSAQRYPEDYDGIIAGAPANDWTGLIFGFIWNMQSQLASPESYIPASKSETIQKAAIAQCDRLDGVSDGLIGAPQSCRFDPRKLLCKAKPDDSCLTQPQIDTLARIYRGPHTSAGVQLFPGFTPGAEVGVLPGSGWDGWIFGDAAGNAVQAHFARNTMRNVFTANDRWEFGRFDFDRDTAPLVAKYAPILSATDPDLSRYVDRGGKLILFHGWADAAIPPLNTVKYYQSVVDKMGAQKSASAVRLFMVPGLQHCFPGAGPWSFGGLSAAVTPADPSTDLSAALERWVEQGVAPQSVRAVEPKDLLAGLFDARKGGVESSGLLCAWPKHAKWNGSGSTRDAANYACVE
jgi:hypothetical protein